MAIFLLMPAVMYSQFQMPIGAGVGFRMNSDKTYNINTASVNISPQVRIGDIFTLSEETVTYLSSDTTDEGYAGLKLDAVAHRIDWDETISGSVHGLIGFHGQKMVGLGASYRKGDYGLNLDVSKELRDNTLVATLSVSYMVLK